MKLTINGNETDMKDGLTVTGLIGELEIEPARVAVEINLNIVKKCDFEKHILKDGDAVEIVNFVGGG
jgi:thiamine biosynthesis protein ThiS